MTEEPEVRSTTTANSLATPGAKLGGGRFAVATFVTLAGVATFTPMIMATMLQVPFTWNGSFSTGGLVAFASSIAMWVWCRSWRAWRRWIWLPIAITLALAFMVVNIAREQTQADAEKARQQRVAACVATEGEIANATAERRQLVDAAREYGASVGVIMRDWDGTPPAPGAIDWSKYGGTRDGTKSAWDYFVRGGGQQVDQRLQSLNRQYNRHCPVTMPSSSS